MLLQYILETVERRTPNSCSKDCNNMILAVMEATIQYATLVEEQTTDHCFPKTLRNCVMIKKKKKKQQQQKHSDGN